MDSKHVGDVDLADMHALSERAADAFGRGDLFETYRLLGEVVDGGVAARTWLRDELNRRAEHAGVTKRVEAPV